MAIGKKLQELLSCKNITVSQLAKNTGVPASTIYGIINRNNEKVNLDTLNKICNELGVKLEYFTEEGQNESSDELTEYLDMLHKRPEMKMLFSVSKKATKEEVEKAVKIIEMFKGNNNSDGDDI